MFQKFEKTLFRKSHEKCDPKVLSCRFYYVATIAITDNKKPGHFRAKTFPVNVCLPPVYFCAKKSFLSPLVFA